MFNKALILFASKQKLHKMSPTVKTSCEQSLKISVMLLTNSQLYYYIYLLQSGKGPHNQE